MRTLTLARPVFTPNTDFDAAFDAGEITWVLIDAPTYAPVAAPARRTPAEIKHHVTTIRDAMIAESTPATPDPAMFRLGGKALRKLAYTPTGRDAKGGAAARAEIARRASK